MSTHPSTAGAGIWLAHAHDGWRLMAKKRPAVRCSSTTKKGGPCGSFAIVGATVCKQHGGFAPQVRRKAAERVQAAKLDRAVAKYATPRDDVTPSVALVEELKRSAGFVSWLGDRLTSSSQPLGSVEWQRFSEERDRLTRLSVELARLGIETTLITTEGERIRKEATKTAHDFMMKLLAASLGQLGIEPHNTQRFAAELGMHTLEQARDHEAREMPEPLRGALLKVTAERAARERELEDRVAELEAELVAVRARVAADGVRDRLAIGSRPAVDPFDDGEPDEPVSPPEVLEPDAVIDAPSKPHRQQSVRQHFNDARRASGFSGPRRF